MHYKVLTAFLHLQIFFTAVLLIVIGIGGTRTPVLDMLLNVPITVGTDLVHASDIVYTTFRVLDAPSSHIILRQ